MFGFKKIIFMLVITILLLGFVATPLTVLAGLKNLKVAVVYEDADRWMTQVIPLFEDENTGVKVEYDIMPWEPLYEKIMEIMTGCIVDCYDVVMMASTTPSGKTLGEWYEEISTYYAEDLTKHRKDFESAGIDFVEYNGKILGVNSPGPHADQDWMLIISKNSKNKELALKLLMLAGGGSLLDFIPTVLAGFTDAPLSASFDPAELFEGVQVPGGYAGREWITEENFALAMVMDFISPQDAAQMLVKGKPRGAIEIKLGGEGYKAEELLANGSTGFGVILWQRGRFLIVVGGGILDSDGRIPPYETLMKLANDIDQAISNSSMSLEGQLDILPREKTLTSQYESSDISSSPVVSINSPTKMEADLIQKDGTKNGSITFQFDVVKVGEDKNCDYLEIRVYITKICLGNYDGDWWWKGDGDICVGGSINIHNQCGSTKSTGTIKFATKEICYLGPNECTGEKGVDPVRKFLGMVRSKGNTGTKPTVTYDILVRDNDSGDVGDIILPVEYAIVGMAVGSDIAKKANQAKNSVRNKGEDTTGAGVGFATLRKISGDDLGEALTGTKKFPLK